MCQIYTNDQSGKQLKRGTVLVSDLLHCSPIYCFISSTTLNNHVVTNVKTLQKFNSNLLTIKNAIDQLKEYDPVLIRKEEVLESLENMYKKNQTIQNSASQIYEKIEGVDNKTTAYRKLEKLKPLLENLAKKDFQNQLEEIRDKLKNMDSATNPDVFESIFSLFDAHSEKIVKKVYSSISQEMQQQENRTKKIQTKKKFETIFLEQFIRECNRFKNEISEQSEIAFICALKTSTLILENLKKTLNFA